MTRLTGFFCLLAAAMIALYGCATPSSVLVNPHAQRVDYRSVYVVVHGGNSADMDANVQKDFLRHGFAVTVGPDGAAITDTQLIARYADDWKWDMAMYLHTFDVMIFDARTNMLLASGSWKNSVLHGFYDSEKVVSQVVDNTLSKITTQ